MTDELLRELSTICLQNESKERKAAANFSMAEGLAVGSGRRGFSSRVAQEFSAAHAENADFWEAIGDALAELAALRAFKAKHDAAVGTLPDN
jgi:hypothetical protein